MESCSARDEVRLPATGIGPAPTMPSAFLPSCLAFLIKDYFPQRASSRKVWQLLLVAKAALVQDGFKVESVCRIFLFQMCLEPRLYSFGKLWLCIDVPKVVSRPQCRQLLFFLVIEPLRVVPVHEFGIDVNPRRRSPPGYSGISKFLVFA